MHYYKCSVQYDGTGYFGFQWQSGIPTVQNELNLALKKLLIGKSSTLGASRTDTGVHAIEQFVKLTLEQKIDCDSFLKDLNEVLHPQVRCLSLAPCTGTFNPISGASSKEYRYFFTNTPRSSGTEQRFVANNPYALDISLMQRCVEEIVGEKSFHNFVSAGSNVKSTVREILECELTQVDLHTVLPESFLMPSDLRQCYQFRIVGTGFLKQMVRHLMSALWRVGSGNITTDEFFSLVNGPQKSGRLWKVASPRGLHLYKINY